MKLNHVINIIFVFISVVFLSTCKKNNSEPTESINHEGPILSSTFPYIRPPHIYITIDAKRMMCGTTIMDTIIKNPSNTIKAKFTTLSGDSEEFYLLGYLVHQLKDLLVWDMKFLYCLQMAFK